MAARLNGLDYAILALIALCALRGLTRGVLRMATSILSLLAGLYFASLYYSRAGAVVQKQFHASQAVGAVIGYAVIFAAVFIAVEYAGGRIIRLVRIIHLNWADRLGGTIFGAAIGAILAGLAVVLLTVSLGSNPPLLRDSELAPRVLAYNRVLLAYIPPQVQKEYEEKRDELYKYWKKEALLSSANANRARASASPV